MLLARRVWQVSGAPLGWRSALAVLLVHGLLFAGAMRFADSDQKNFSALDTANELAGNGMFDFFAALRRNELSFERYYATIPISEALATVRAAFPHSEWIEPDRGGVERHVAVRGVAKRLNVILVSVESLGAEFLGVLEASRFVHLAAFVNAPGKGAEEAHVAHASRALAQLRSPAPSTDEPGDETAHTEV